MKKPTRVGIIMSLLEERRALHKHALAAALFEAGFATDPRHLRALIAACRYYKDCQIKCVKGVYTLLSEPLPKGIHRRSDDRLFVARAGRTVTTHRTRKEAVEWFAQQTSS